jgi:hypothetical protein
MEFRYTRRDVTLSVIISGAFLLAGAALVMKLLGLV